MGKAKKQAELIETLPQVFRSVMKKWCLAPGDFPDLHDFQVPRHFYIEFQKSYAAGLWLIFRSYIFLLKNWTNYSLYSAQAT